MPDESFQEKTEQATPRKRREAREEGNVAKSMEVNSAIVLVVGIVGLKFLAGRYMDHLKFVMKWIFTRISVIEITTDNVVDYMIQGFQFLGMLMAPLAIVIMIAGLLSNILQSGFMLSAKTMAPKFSKMNPLKGLKKMVSMKSFLEVVKGILKVTIIGIVTYITIKNEVDIFPYLIDQNAESLLGIVGAIGYKIGIRASIVLIILAAFDYAYQRYDYEKNLRMTKQEVKEEYKRVEGDPIVKARIRSIQRERARQRMLSEVPKADVIITNPTHLAIALRYDSEKALAPVVVAKGARLIAQKIKEIAKENGVPIVENKPVARMLFKTTDVGMEIPYELYQAVAEILAYVYQLKNGYRA